jgi:hypothetical protein
MKTLAIFVVLLAITVAMQLKESPPRPIESWGFMGLQPHQSPPSQVGTGGLGGFQLPTNDSLPVRKPSLRSSKSGMESCYFLLSCYFYYLLGKKSS